MELKKETVLQLVDWIEELLDENSTLRQYVNRFHKEQEIRRKKNPEIRPAPTALQLIQGMRQARGTRSLAKDQTDLLRAAIEQADVDSKIQELLRTLPTSERVN